jgi:2-aminobenzoate-CoA ligase
MARHAAPFDPLDTAADDVCLISFTSGTTGVPKGTMHFHRDILAICDCFPPHTLGTSADDVFIGTPPLAFTFGLGGLLLFPMRAGAAGVLLEKLTPESLLAAIQRFRATVCFTAPTFYRQMTPLVPRYDLRSLRKCVSAGEALPLATREGWQAATGIAMIDGIGATELLHIFISASGADIRPGATGKPVPGYRACVLDDDGRPVGPGVIGRLAVKGPTGCRYLADDRQRDYVLDGWNLTGDSYEMDADGYFHYRSRTDDMIISAGYNIAGAEVEEVLLRHPAVAECGVVGRADEERGQIVEAHVVLKPGHEPTPETARTLQDFVKAQIAPYKYPRAVRFTDKLPRTETGKLQRFKLRQS